MITTPADYLAQLAQIQNSVTRDVEMASINPSSEPRFKIDANTRAIKVPPELKSIGALNDHRAETVYFEIDRYFDDVDLYSKACAIQYINAKGQKFLHPSGYKALSDNGNKLIFGWEIWSDVTAAVGKVKFSVRFYELDTIYESDGTTVKEYRFNYNLNTAIATVEVTDSLDIFDSDEVIPSGEAVSQLLQESSQILTKIEDALSELQQRDSYTSLNDKPQINGVTLSGNKTTSDLLINYSDIANKPRINDVELLGSLNTENLHLDYSKLENLPTLNGTEIKGAITSTGLSFDGSKITLNIPSDILTESKVDAELKANSTYPVQNKAIYSTVSDFNTKFSNNDKKFTELEDDLTSLDNKIDTTKTNLEEEIERLWEELGGMSYVAAQILSFTCNPNIAEKGSTVSSLVFNWELNKELTGASDSISLESMTLNTSDRNYTISGNIQSDKDFTLKVIDRGNEVTATTSIKFYNGVYYGVNTEAELYDNAFILALNKKLQATRNTSFSVEAGEGQYIYFCAPAAYGDPTFTVGGFDGGFSKVATLNFTNSSNHSEEYYIYKSDNPNLGNTTIQVK